MQNIRAIIVCFSFMLVLFVACQKKESTIQLGKSTVQDLYSIEGKPDTQQGDLHIYKQQSLNFQSSKGVIVGRYRGPNPEESKVSFWQNKWRGEDLIYQTYTEGHTDLIEIQQVETGSSVFFDLRANRVVRVLEFKRD